MVPAAVAAAMRTSTGMPKGVSAKTERALGAVLLLALDGRALLGETLVRAGLFVGLDSVAALVSRPRGLIQPVVQAAVVIPVVLSSSRLTSQRGSTSSKNQSETLHSPKTKLARHLISGLCCGSLVESGCLSGFPLIPVLH